MKALLGHGVVFILLYVVLMIPTYLLPLLGSNSVALNALTMTGAHLGGQSVATGINPLFWLHLGALALLVAVTWFRGSLIARQWLVIFPILALAFDLIPGLSSVPLVPTVMHLLAMTLGVTVGQVATAKV